MVGLQQGWSHIYDEGQVAAAQHLLNPHLWVQPFLTTPPVAWLVPPLASLPYNVAYGIWSMVTFGALAAALAWSSGYRGIARWVATGAAIVPWWVLHAVHVGQVAPLIAASVLVAWRLLRHKRDVAAGLVLVPLPLKPHTAGPLPLPPLVAGRREGFSTWRGAPSFGAVAH